jgi:hypothetical protein
MSGLNEIKINFDHTVIHIPHSDKTRLENFKGYDPNELSEIENTLDIPDENIRKWNSEYLLSMKHIENNKKIAPLSDNYYVSPKTKWKVQQIDDQIYYAEEVFKNNKLSGFPSVYYVSLEESLDRQQNIEKQFEEYGIDVSLIQSKRFSESNDNVTGKYVHTLNDGTKGCCVSHLKAIKQWYETTDDDCGFFCEDDLSLETVEHWNFSWGEFVEKIPNDADCVQLLIIRDDFDTFDIRKRYWNDWGATAYIITRKYAEQIINTYIKQDTYHLEIPNSDAMPLIENILFSISENVYACPLFVEEINFQSTFVGEDDDVKDGQKNNHYIAHHKVLDWWKHKTQKNELEILLEKYSLDTENPENNFNLGLWYEDHGHTAPALSYYLRCAERSEDDDLTYEALIRGSFCYEKQKDRCGSSRSLLFQAQAFRPDRPEAYYLLSKYSEKNQWWQDCYITADSALRHCNFNCPELKTDVDYPGKYGLLFEKAISAWWWGKGMETRILLQEIKNNYEVHPKHFDIIQNHLIQLATGYIPESELKYNKSNNQKLRFEFEGSDQVDKNYSQAFQDLFVLTALNGKRHGTYLEIGAQQPFYQNNTALLETKFNWKGVSIEIREDLCKMFSEQRNNKILCQDATRIDYSNLLQEFDSGNIIDYLQLDCEPSKTTFEILTMIPFDQYKFRLITYEHDHYVDLTNTYRNKSREYLQERGYLLLVSNVSLNEWSPFEDWWYHPELVDPQIVDKMKCISDITDIRKYMIEI